MQPLTTLEWHRSVAQALLDLIDDTWTDAYVNAMRLMVVACDALERASIHRLHREGMAA